jgi:hypothetical protein
MRNFIAVAASLLINLGLVVAFQHSAENASPVPSGEVTVTDLNGDAVPTLAAVL